MTSTIHAKDGIFKIARSVKQAQDLIETKGAPVFVSLEHDLGGLFANRNGFLHMAC